MVRAFLLSVGQLADRAILAVLAKSLALTIVLFAAIAAALWFLAHWLTTGWLETGEAVAGALAFTAAMSALLGAWLLFRAVAIAVIGLFADDVVRAVEARHYPARLADAHDLSLARSARMGLGSALRALAINLGLLPLYLVLIVTGVGTAFVFLVVNAWLLGRDLGDMVAVRHVEPATIGDWRRATRISRFVLGLAIAGLFMIPFANLIAPILGAAMATHLFHDEDQI
ncbi:EI24 domain-containing protein [Stakelama saccharophila]|uniref:EI24 domain-containing protein n=1 Tax=Stakelama saccharophila TaxID=3075605 RepID=A0ABZ0BB63_9SPHN|nr:EI24 domain-containing protein [Stakelama sp. W311]WNO54529.1 EI24 domain-containing protein [Stakelama sp. W311]